MPRWSGVRPSRMYCSRAGPPRASIGMATKSSSECTLESLLCSPRLLSCDPFPVPSTPPQRRLNVPASASLWRGRHTKTATVFTPPHCSNCTFIQPPAPVLVLPPPLPAPPTLSRGRALPERVRRVATARNTHRPDFVRRRELREMWIQRIQHLLVVLVYTCWPRTVSVVCHFTH